MASRLRFVPPLWFAIGASGMLIAACFLGHQVALLRVTIPLCSVLIGAVLYFRRPLAYCQFTLWLWFLTPLLRRLIDLRFGYADENLVLLAPILVTAVAGLALTKAPGANKEVMPFLLCAAGVIYGFLIGMILHPSSDVVYGLFNWLAPILLGLFIYTQWPLYPEHRRAIERTLLLGVLVMGAYGVYQYWNPPAWDIYWWESLPYSIADSFGRPLKFQIRVWSTLNAPAPFAGVMGTALLINLASRTKWKLVCSLAGVAALGLSLSRTEWVAFAVGALFILYRSGRTQMMRALVVAAMLIAVCLSLSSLGPAQGIIAQRLATFQHLSQDESVQTRSAMYDRLMGDVIRNPFGQGVSNAAVYDGYALDSGPLRFLLKLGILGTLFYFIGISQVLFRLIPKRLCADHLQVACGAVLLAALVKFISLSAFESAGGAMLWLAIGLGLAARRFHGEAARALTAHEEYAYAD